MATDSAIRDAIGGLIDMFALAERDSLIASRIVISSHESLTRNEALQEIFRLERLASRGPAVSRALAKLTFELRELNMPEA